MAQLNIQDNSGDKEFFTIIPNYIANHSTANDQALYFQIKKHAGENGKCFATEKTLMQKLGIGKKAYDKSMDYLLEKKWITFIGLTSGKTRPIKTYRVNNIWKLNNQHYKKISSKSNVSFNEKISAESRGDKFQKQHKISAESNVEEEPVLIRTNNKTIHKCIGSKAPEYGNEELNKLIELDKELKFSLQGTIKTNRRYAYLLLKKFGLVKCEKLVRASLNCRGERYAPQINEFKQLYYKVGDLVSFYKKEQNNKLKGVSV